MKNLQKVVAVASLMVALYSCDDKKDDILSSDQKDKLLIGLVTPAGTSTYITSFKDLTVGSISATQSFETKSNSWYSTYKDYAFVNESRYGNRFLRYKRNDNGALSEAGIITLPSGASNANTLFVSDTEAYTSCVGIDKIIKFNPISFTQTGTLDIPANISTAEAADGSLNPTAMAVIGNNLFVTCQQSNATGLSEGSATVAIFDKSTGTVIKVIKDARATGAGGHPGMNDGIFKDEIGDLYVYCHGSFGFAGPSQKNGWLRIKAGTTEFDPTYFFNITDMNVPALTGGKTDYIYQFIYFANGIFYGTCNVPGFASTPPDFTNDRTFQPVKIDVRNKTIEVIAGLKPGSGAGCALTKFDNKILFSLNTKNNGIGIFTYDPANGQTSAAPVVTSSLFPVSIRVFQ